MKRPLATAGGLVSIAPLVLVDLETGAGVTGCAYVFCYTTLALRPVADLITGLADFLRNDPVAPIDIAAKLEQRFRLLGPQGLIGIACAAIDMAAWDAAAKSAGLPLARLLGGAGKPTPAYNSNGLGLMPPARAAAESIELAAGFAAIKIRLGHPTIAADIEAVRAVRSAVGPDVQLMSDYNQSLPVAEAITRARALEAEGLAWIEEPTRADDYDGHAAIRRASRTPIQLGENWWGPHDMAKSIAAGASDLLMPDASKIGGVTGWLRASAQAHAAGLPVSSHLYPEISAHLLAVTPAAHWLEYVDWAEPVLAAPLQFDKGRAIPSDKPGIGIEWDEEAIARLV